MSTHNTSLCGEMKENYINFVSIFFNQSKEILLGFSIYKGVSISNQPILFPMDRDGHDFHALFQYMIYTWVQN